MKTCALLAVALMGGGCSRADMVEPKDPFAPLRQQRTVAAKQLKPNLMILVDRSASMNLPTDPLAPGCSSECRGRLCLAGCPTRSSEIAAGLATFLDERGAEIRMGLATFPSSLDACDQGEVLVNLTSRPQDVDAEQLADAASIKAKLSSLRGTGGFHSIAAALRSLESYPPLLNPDSRWNHEDFVLLVTDGAAVAGWCGSETNGVRELRKKDIRTIVIGFGPEATAPSLSAMAREGGFAASCPKGTDLECGSNNRCNVASKICVTPYFQASSAAELRAVLLAMTTTIPPQGNLCVFHLEHSRSPLSLVKVIVDDVPVAADSPGGGWSAAGDTVTFKGALCEQVSNSTVFDPVKVEFEISQN